MAALANAKTNGPSFGNAVEIFRIVYDFAADAGAEGSLDVFVADAACVVKLRHMAVKTAFESLGALTLSCGKAAGGVEFLDTVGLGALTANSIHTPDDPDDIYLAAGQKIDMTIGGADATAGKAEFVLEVVKF